jgi:hypothetical protein
MNSRDLVIISAGANDVSKNESRNFLSSLKTRLHGLTHTNVLLYNVPYRYDLIPESCVNAEIKCVNKNIYDICRRFENVKLIDISKIGRRFHNSQGLKLNFLGRRYFMDSLTYHLQGLHKIVSSIKSIPLNW